MAAAAFACTVGCTEAAETAGVAVGQTPPLDATAAASTLHAQFVRWRGRERGWRIERVATRRRGVNQERVATCRDVLMGTRVTENPGCIQRRAFQI